MHVSTQSVNEYGNQIMLLPLKIKILEGMSAIRINRIYIQNVGAFTSNTFVFKVKDEYADFSTVDNISNSNLSYSNVSQYFPEGQGTDYRINKSFDISEGTDYFDFSVSFEPIEITHVNYGTFNSILHIEYSNAETGSGTSLYTINITGSCSIGSVESIDGVNVDYILSVSSVLFNEEITIK